MFLFYWLDIFPGPYWNGFADGMAATSLFVMIKAIARFNGYCQQYRADLETLIFKTQIGDISVAEIDSAINKTTVNPALPHVQKQRILEHLYLLRKYHRKWFQEYADSQDLVLSAMLKEKISPTALLFRNPLSVLAVWSIRS